MKAFIGELFIFLKSKPTEEQLVEIDSYLHQHIDPEHINFSTEFIPSTLFNEGAGLVKLFIYSNVSNLFDVNAFVDGLQNEEKGWIGAMFVSAAENNVSYQLTFFCSKDLPHRKELVGSYVETAINIMKSSLEEFKE